MGHLNGKIQEPKLDDPTYEKLEVENYTIMSWLLNLMQLGQRYLFLRTAKEIWDVAAQTYSKMGNVRQIY